MHTSKTRFRRAAGVARGLRALAALRGDLGSVLSNHTASSGLLGHQVHTCVDMHAARTLIQDPTSPCKKSVVFQHRAMTKSRRKLGKQSLHKSTKKAQI